MATTGGIVVSSTKTPQAVDDSIVTTEDLGIKINVLANDLGGVATSLYSIDQTGSLNIVRTSTTALGATIYITSDGQVYYDPTHASALQALTQGEQAVDSFVYEDRLGNGTISTARVYVTVTGTNDAPKANTDIASTKSDTVANIDVLANDVDPDHGAVLSIKSFDAVSASGAAISQTVDATGRVVIHYDPSRSATLQGLAEGQTATDTFTYSVTDEHGAVSTTTVTVTVTGVTPNSALTDPCFADEDPASFGALAIGTNGDDHLVGSSQGHTLVSGGTGDDDISVQAGGNHVCAGSGNDSVALNGNASNSEVDGEDGNDVIVAGAAGETGLTAPAADMVWSSTIDGGAGDDKILLVHAAHSTLLGGDGNDTIIVDSGGGDLIDAGAGHDFIMSLDFLSRADGGNNGAVTLEGGAGNDTIHRLAEGDGVFGSTLDGGDGNDDISIHEVNRGAAGTVAVNGGSGDDHVFIEYVAATDAGVAAQSRLLIDGGDGNDTLDTRGAYVAAAVTAGTGDDTVILGSDYTVGIEVSGGAGNDTIAGDHATNARINGDAGDDTIDIMTGAAVNSTIHGGDGADAISARGFGNRVFGDAGNDLIRLTQDDRHQAGNEVDGGSGIDVITSGHVQDWQAVNWESPITAATPDMVWNSTIDGGGDSDKILLLHAAHSTILGGDGNDNIIVDSGGDDLIDAGAGHDFIMSLDFLSRADGGDNGAVTLEGGAGNDTIHRLAEGDNVFGSTLDGGDGNDDIAIHEVNRGGAAETVVINGGSGDDKVFIEHLAVNDPGVAAQSRLLVDGGDGNDTINTTGAGVRTVVTAGAGDDTVMVRNTGSEIYGGDGNDRIVNVNPGENVLVSSTVDGGSGDDTIDVVSAGTINSTIHGGDGIDTISVNGFGNRIFGDAGNDLIRVKQDDKYQAGDEVHGGSGIDVITSGHVQDWQAVNWETGLTAPTADMVWNSMIDGGGDSDKILLRHAAHSTILGGDGNDNIIVDSGGDDLIDAGAGHDFIMSLDFLSRADGGNNGAVTLEGGAGNDTIHRLADGDGVFGSTLDGGDGNDDISIHEVNRGAAGTVAVNGGSGDDHVFIEYVVAIDAGVAAQSRLLIDGGDGNDILDTRGAYVATVVTAGTGDDTVILGSDYTVGIEVLGGDGNDTIAGDHATNAHINGDAGDDIITISGSGNQIAGGAGADTLVFRVGFGSAAVVDYTIGDDSINFQSGTFSSIDDLLQNHAAQVGTDVVITDIAGDTLTLRSVALAEVQAHASDFHLI